MLRIYNNHRIFQHSIEHQIIFIIVSFLFTKDPILNLLKIFKILAQSKLINYQHRIFGFLAKMMLRSRESVVEHTISPIKLIEHHLNRKLAFRDERQNYDLLDLSGAALKRLLFSI